MISAEKTVQQPPGENPVAYFFRTVFSTELFISRKLTSLFGGIFRKQELEPRNGLRWPRENTIRLVSGGAVCRETSTVNSVNGPASFTLYKYNDRKKQRRRLSPGAAFNRFFNTHVPGIKGVDNRYFELLTGYVGRIPLLLRDLEYQLLSAKNQSAGFDCMRMLYSACGGFADSPGENPLESYAVTVHGIKIASYGILALETVKKSEELEKAAQQGDMSFLERETPSFLEYMGHFIEGLEKFIEKEQKKRSGPSGNFSFSPD